MSHSKASGNAMIDIHVGMRLRLRRLSLGMTVDDLAAATRRELLTIEGWERGDARISAAELFELAQLLEMPMTFFYDGLENGSLGGSGATTAGSLAERVEMQAGQLKEAEGRRLLNFYYDQLNPDRKRQLIDVARVFSESVPARTSVDADPPKIPRACN